MGHATDEHQVGGKPAAAVEVQGAGNGGDKAAEHNEANAGCVTDSFG
ncbi:MAG: hypothetical protein ABI568_14930 [Pseudarthrobacter sp.]